MSSLECEDNNNGWAHNTPSCIWRKVDMSERDQERQRERGCSFLVVQGRSYRRRGTEVGKGRGGEGGS